MIQITPIKERLLKMVDWSGCAAGEICWNWIGDVLDHNGYPSLCIKEQKGWRSRRAHRLSFREFNGLIPVGMLVRHTCNNRLCINPRHLLLGTSQDNVNDRVRAGRSSKVGNRGNNKGEINGRHKLSAIEVKQIRELYIPGYGNRVKLAKQFGVEVNTISLIYKNKTWRI